MPNESAAATTLSLRLTPGERQLIEDAAAKKGWKAANFLRVTALERAAQVLNLSRPTSFDFSGAAKHLAEVMLAPRGFNLIKVDDETDLGRFCEQFDLDRPFDLGGRNADDFRLSDVRPANLGPPRLTSDEVDKLQEAMRLGGPEFAAELLVECRRRLDVGNDPNLPPPIDPHNLKD